MLKDKMLEQAADKLSQKLVLVHKARYPLTAMEAKKYPGRYKFKDVLEEIMEQGLTVAYQRWTQTTDFSNVIEPVRRVNKIMHQDTLTVHCNNSFVDELNANAKLLRVEPEVLFNTVMAKIGCDVTKMVFFGVLHIMLTDGLQIK